MRIFSPSPNALYHAVRPGSKVEAIGVGGKPYSYEVAYCGVQFWSFMWRNHEGDLNDNGLACKNCLRMVRREASLSN